MNERGVSLICIIVSLCLSFAFLTDRHAIYISVLEIEANEIRIKIFSDDLETALINYTKTSFQLNDCAEQKEVIQPYFQQHINLKINRQHIPLRIKSCQVENDTHWIVFEIDAPDSWQYLHLEANYLMEIFPTQSNIIQLNYDQKKQFARLNKQSAIFSTEINK